MSKRSESFDNRFDDLARLYNDPIEILFKISSGSLEMGPDYIDEEGNQVHVPVPIGDRRAAAAELVSYRYPKRKALEITDSDGNDGFSFVMLAPNQPLPVKSLQVEKKRRPPSSVAHAIPPVRALNSVPHDFMPANQEFA
jgi:hypothetical protein